MNTNIILLGTSHGEIESDQAKMNQAVLADAFSEGIILDEMNDHQSILIIAEIGYRKNILRNDHPDYENYFCKISKKLYESDFGPDILPADTRTIKEKQIQKFSEKLRTMHIWAFTPGNLQMLGLRNLPKNLEELLTLIDSPINKPFLKKTPPTNIVEVAKYIRVQTTEMEKNFIDNAYKYKDDYEKILLVTGAVHTIIMHQKTGFSYRLPNYNESYFKLLYYNYLIHHYVLDLVLES